MIKISDFLQERQMNKGKCKACDKLVQWTQKKLASHKRVNCPQASAEEKAMFQGVPVPASLRK